MASIQGPAETNPGVRRDVLVRIVPFAAFLVLTSLQGSFGPDSVYWVYLLKTLVGAAGLVWMWREVSEMRWRFSGTACLAGVVVFALWVGLDPYYPRLGHSTHSWNPHLAYPNHPALGWFFVVVRVLGSTLVVPPLEEVVYRSFIYRAIQSSDFLSVPLSRVHLPALLITATVFGLTHHEWLAGILCGMIYQAVVCLKGRLGDAIVAHAITNLLLGLWVIWRGAWSFW